MEGVVSTGNSRLRAGPEVEFFANALDDCMAPRLSPADKRQRILDLPRKYYENALRRLAHVRPSKAREVDVDMDMDEAEQNAANELSPDEIKRIEKEAQTWDLVRRLLPLRYSGSTVKAPSVFSSKASGTGILQKFLESDPLAQERRVVVQWLQTNAASGPDIDELARELQQNADRGDIIAHGWLHTRSSIKLRKSVTAWPHLLDRQSPNIANTHVNSDGAPLVTQLDPDAPTRQGRKLEPQDEYFERAIWLGCFEHLRRGSSRDSIREWCQERTEMWRAISTSAALLSTDDSEPTPESDAASLALWRRMCFSLARQGGCDDYERAVYGVLSGDIPSVEKVALTWDDFLFANYNALLRTQFDNYLLSQCPPEKATGLTQTFASFDAIQFHGDPATAAKRLIGSLKSNKQIQAEANEPAKALQASLISGEIAEHLYEQGAVICDSATDKTPSNLLYRFDSRPVEVNSERFFKSSEFDGLRITSHIYLLITLLEKLDAKPQAFLVSTTPLTLRYNQENIVAAYTDYLRRAQLPELIPLYCSVLDEMRCYEVLSFNLIFIEDDKQRRQQLKLIQEAGIDVLSFVRKQAALMYEALGPEKDQFLARNSFKIVEPGPPTARRGRPIKPDYFGEDEDVVEPKHEYLIRSLEWLLNVSETFPHAFAYGTMIYKYFLKNMHLNAARLLMRRVPFSEIVGRSSDQDEVEGAWTEDLDFWEQHLERSGARDVTAAQVAKDARNFRELEFLVRVLDNIETIASLSVISNEEPPPTREFWNKVGDEVKNAKEHMQPLLNNWLIPGIQEGDKDLRDLRSAYLTETVLAYVSSLHFAGTSLSRDNLLECMELAAIIAERNSDLATAFVEAGRMKELVEAFAAASKALAISTGDKRAAGSSSKKLREMGWSRDLWSVKP